MSDELNARDVAKRAAAAIRRRADFLRGAGYTERAVQDVRGVAYWLASNAGIEAIGHTDMLDAPAPMPSAEMPQEEAEQVFRNGWEAGHAAATSSILGGETERALIRATQALEDIIAMGMGGTYAAAIDRAYRAIVALPPLSPLPKAAPFTSAAKEPTR
jgi:hypothetical protein